MDQEEINKYIEAGKIAGKIRTFIKSFVKVGMPLKEITDTIIKKIEENNAIPAFPPTTSIDEVAAHYHPSNSDETKASGLIKVDFGVSVDGYIADTALSIDLTENNEHKDLIDSSLEALNNVIELIKKDPLNTTINDIGKTVQDSIENKGFSPIVNLSGHSLDRFNVHSGLTIPNYANGNDKILTPGAYAIEPFATNGEGKIYAGNAGNIYELKNEKSPRSPKAREILEFVINKYKTLPFGQAEIEEKFGPMSKLALSELERQEIIHHHNALIEKAKGFVAQSEHTILITNEGEVIVTTLEE